MLQSKMSPVDVAHLTLIARQPGGFWRVLCSRSQTNKAFLSDAQHLHRLDFSLSLFQICLKGKVHIFKYLNMQGCRLDKKPDTLDLPTLGKRCLLQPLTDRYGNLNSSISFPVSPHVPYASTSFPTVLSLDPPHISVCFARLQHGRFLSQ